MNTKDIIENINPALEELDRINWLGFEEDRYRERARALDNLSRLVRELSANRTDNPIYDLITRDSATLSYGSRFLSWVPSRGYFIVSEIAEGMGISPEVTYIEGVKAIESNRRIVYTSDNEREAVRVLKEGLPDDK